MPSRRRSSTPNWFDSSLYASLEQCELQPFTCIAPTQRGSRCKLSNGSCANTQSRSLRMYIEAHSDSPNREDVIRDFLLSHCCKSWHRAKLERDPDGCLKELVQRYDASLMATASVPPSNVYTSRSVESAAPPSSPVGTQEKREINLTDVHASKQRPGMVLRSRAIGNAKAQSPETTQDDTEYFSPYKSKLSDTVHNKLMADVCHVKVQRGVVYSFTWPSHPGFVKIGHSSKDGQARVNEWLSCHPGAVLSKQVVVDYPERIERLVHLQIASYRRKIVRCSNPGCEKSHIEWFELPKSEVNQVIDEWTELTAREPLYGGDKWLTSRWMARIQRANGDVTARKLLDLLDAEAESKPTISDDNLEGVSSLQIEMSRTSTPIQPQSAPDLEAIAQALVKATEVIEQQQKMLKYFEDFMLQLSQSGIMGVERRSDPEPTPGEIDPVGTHIVGTVVAVR